MICRNDLSTPLYIACQEGYINLVNLLTPCSKCLNNKTNNGTTPVFVAIKNGHIIVVRELIQNSVDINTCTKEGWSPLQAASNNNHIEVVKELLKCKDIELIIGMIMQVSMHFVMSQRPHRNSEGID